MPRHSYMSTLWRAIRPIANGLREYSGAILSLIRRRSANPFLSELQAGLRKLGRKLGPVLGELGGRSHCFTRIRHEAACSVSPKNYGTLSSRQLMMEPAGGIGDPTNRGGWCLPGFWPRLPAWSM